MIQKDLLAACWTWAGDVGPGDRDERSPIPLSERLTAVTAVGWAGVGFSHADIVEYRDTIGLPRVKQMIDDAGIRRVELEFLTDWWQLGDRRAKADQMRDDLFDAATILDAPAIKVGAINSTGEPAPTLSQLADAYHHLAERARTFKLDIAVEALGGAYISTLADSIQLAKAADHPNAGLVVDVYHCARAGEDDYSQLPVLLDEVAVTIVELGDAPLLADGTVGPRCLPGSGDLDVSRFIAEMWRAGWRGYWGVEIIAPDLRALPIAEGVTAVHDGATAMLTAADHLIVSEPTTQTNHLRWP